jgi:protein required for attachment to host cells
MVTHWFVVASQKTVKILEEGKSKGRSSGRKKFKLIKSLDNPLGRLRNRELIRKQAGRGTRSMGSAGSHHHSETKRHDPHEQAAIQFARELVRYLEIERQHKKFKSLTIVAEPHFLGKIKAEMGAKLTQTIESWIQKDLLKTPQNELTEFLLPN